MLAERLGIHAEEKWDDADDDDLEAEAAALRAEARQRALAAEAERLVRFATWDAATPFHEYLRALSEAAVFVPLSSHWHSC